AYLPTGELLSGGRDGQLRRWDAAGKPLRQDAHPEGVILTLAATPDGRSIATAANRVCFWDARTMKQLPHTGGHARGIYRIAFSPDGARLVTASADQTARVWDAKTGQALTEMRGHAGEVLGAVFSPDGRWVATASRDRTARLWDAATGKQVRAFEGHTGQLLRAAFAPDGKTLATAGEHGEVKL